MTDAQASKATDGSPNFRALASLSPAVNRKIEPFGAAFLAHARRQRHGRTFSEDDRIQALAKVKKTEDEDDGEISEPEDPMMLQRDAKDWKVGSLLTPVTPPTMLT
jgi:DnaJ homolog subfamily C member 2